jgi:hypothetical protein
MPPLAPGISDGDGLAPVSLEVLDVDVEVEPLDDVELDEVVVVGRVVVRVVVVLAVVVVLLVDVVVDPVIVNVPHAPVGGVLLLLT